MISIRPPYLCRGILTIKWIVFPLLCLTFNISCIKWVEVSRIENNKYSVWAELYATGGATLPIYFKIYYENNISTFGMRHKLMEMTSCAMDVRFALSSDNILFYSTMNRIGDHNKYFFITNLNCPGDGFEISCKQLDGWKDRNTFVEKVSGYVRAKQGNLKDIDELRHISVRTDFHYDESGVVIIDRPSADLFVINAEKTELIDIKDNNIVFAVKWYCRNKPDTFSFPILEHQKMATDPDWINSIFDKRK